jgi:protein ImuB
MARVISLYLPRWSTDRLRRRMSSTAPFPEVPLILKGSDGRRRVVLAADRAAETAGIRIGMPVAKAQVLVTNLVIRDANLAADAADLETLARWALRTYSPLVAADPPDGVVMEISGAAHLHGGETALLEGLVRALADKGFEARAAVADTWGAAHALARFIPKPVFILSKDMGSRALPSLPIGALRLPPGMVESLHVLGFETVADLLAQPRAPLVHRFGPLLGRRIDQMFGHLDEPIDPVDLPDVTEVRRRFAEPISAPETIARYTARLTQQLCDVLEGKGLGVRQADLLFTRTDNRIEAIRVGLAQPMRDVKRLTRLLCDKIETVDPGFGIEHMRLIATDAEPLLHKQVSTTDDPAPDIATLLDILSNRIGAERIYRLVPVESDVPERSVRKAPALGESPEGGWPRHWPRPVRLLSNPERITTLAQLPDYPPKAFTWRGVRHLVIAADGPERIFGEWWRRDAEMLAIRDYFRVELTTGERLWIYRSGDGEDAKTGSREWFLHGVFA